MTILSNSEQLITYARVALCVFLVSMSPQNWAQPNAQGLILPPPNATTPPQPAMTSAQRHDTPLTLDPQQQAIAHYSTLSEAAKQNMRFTYKAAQNALKNKQLVIAQAHLSKLQHYPLKPYLEYQLLSKQLAKTPRAAIDRFLADNKHSLLADKLTGSLLYFLAQQERWQEFNHYYTAGFSSTPMRCRSLLARYRTGDLTALDEATSLWNVGKSQPKACDPLFNALTTHHKITPLLRWSRFDKAINSGQLSLARYLKRSMSQPQQVLAELYFKVNAKPSLITQPKTFAHSSPEMQTIIAHGIRKLARQQPQLAWQHWEKYEAQRLFDAELATQTKQQIIKYLTRKGYLVEAEQLLSYSHSLRNPKLIESLIRENLESLNWAAVAKNIAILPPKEQQSDRWQYWYARSHQMLQSKNIDTTAIYTALAAKRSWYGFLAADRIGSHYTLEDATTQANSQLKATLANQPAMQRAKELWLIGEQQQARIEWYYALKHLKNQELLAAGELAKEWGWYNSGIVAMITGNLWDHLTLRFPLAYNNEVAQASIKSQLDETLIYAVARQESAFAADAVSHAGARGLMQLMPATAKEQARHSGITHHRTQDLFTPEHNIHLGSAYLGKLLNEFNGNRVLATAAYNAGKHRVKRWLKTPQTQTPADVWIEVIPFKETRQYVQNVLTYAVIYEYRISSSTSPSLNKPNIDKPNPSAHRQTTPNNTARHTAAQPLNAASNQSPSSWQKGTLLRAQEANITL
ncbi:transglycosylase SLT domain-containing protein [Marinagarivorans algicola]|uniref:transglycosylase SLT domain-containing protein n=1 Tax=Marinagarivorans algicola TaxID=1513270 RepID=UPI0037357E14